MIFNPPVCGQARAGSVSAVHLAARAGLRDVGPYQVELDSLVGPNDDPKDGYRPILIEADPGSVLRVDLDNELPADAALAVTNLHTHGLIVRPTPYDAKHPCPGDYVFQSISPAAASSTAGSHRHYSIDIPAHAIPAAFFEHTGEDEDHPSGLFWFHAHFHEAARQQVTTGMAGLISIGDPMTHLRVDHVENDVSQVDEAQTRLLRAQTDIKYLALRDIQVNVPTCDPAASGCNPDAVLPGNASAPIAATDSADGYDPGLCGGTTKRAGGWCAKPDVSPAGQDHATPFQSVWLFTVNGQLMPSLVEDTGRNHLWRIANLSATVTYVIDLVDGGGAEKSLCVVVIDGVVAGTTGSNGQACNGGQPHSATYGSVGLSRQRILLMPGSRAEVFLPYEAPSGGDATYTLRTIGLNMGNSSPASSGDAWPAIDLATVTIKAPQPVSPAAPVATPMTPLSASLKVSAVRAPLLARSAARVPAAGPDTSLATRAPVPALRLTTRELAQLTADHKGCRFLPAEKEYRRQIVFDENENQDSNGNPVVGGSVFDSHAHYGPGSFALGFRPIEGPLGTGDDKPGLGVHPVSYTMNHMGSADGTMMSPGHMGETRACAVLGRGEVWELVNWTTETHNFHIHQGKFRLARTGDPGLPAGIKEVVIGEATGTPIMEYLAKVADANGDVQAWHDTLPVPPRIEKDASGKTKPGRVFIYVPFIAPQQEGEFVYHCHILEHEDKGMMANIEVVRRRHSPGPGLASR